MRRTIQHLVALLIIVLWAINPVFSQNQKLEEYKVRVGEINKIIKAAMISGKHMSTLEYYCKDAISMPSNEPMQDGIEEISKAKDRMEKSEWRITKYESAPTKVNFSGLLLTEVGRYTISRKRPGMENTLDEVGKYLTVYELQPDESLKIKIEIWNSDSNPTSKTSK
jgi:hypothetical protein